MFAIRTHTIIKHRSRCTLNLYAVDVNGGSLHKQNFVRKLFLEFLVESFSFSEREQNYTNYLPSVGANDSSCLCGYINF